MFLPVLPPFVLHKLRTLRKSSVNAVICRDPLCTFGTHALVGCAVLTEHTIKQMRSLQLIVWPSIMMAPNCSEGSTRAFGSGRPPDLAGTTQKFYPSAKDLMAFQVLLLPSFPLQILILINAAKTSPASGELLACFVPEEEALRHWASEVSQ